MSPRHDWRGCNAHLKPRQSWRGLSILRNQTQISRTTGRRAGPLNGYTRSMMRILFANAASLLIFAFYAADPPVVKEGLWSIHTTSIDNPGNKKSEGTRSICRNHDYDVRIRQLSEKRQKQICKTFTESLAGNTLTVESECNVQGSVMKGKTVTTFSGDSSIHAETHATYTPAVFGTAAMTMIQDQKYAGACPAGMEPGDFMDASGKITHVKRP